MKEHPDLDVVLEELYALDPELRSQAPSIRKLAEELLAAKPDATIDEAFVTKLRLELKARAASRPSTNPFVNFFTMPTNKYLVPGLAVLAIAVIGAATLSTLQRPVGAPTGSDRIAFAPSVERVGDGAFGPLVGQPGGARTESGGGAVGLGAGVSATQPYAALPPMAGGDSAVADKMIVSPDWTPTIYKYTYKGEAITGLSPQVDVYLRTRNPGAAPIGALAEYDLGLMNLSAAKNASVQSFSIAESRENGYVINVNPEEGTINIYENYLTWTYPERACADQACFDSYRLKEGDMLSDEEAVRIAEAFLAEFGVSKDGYGAPSVRAEWRAQLLAAADKSSVWLPDTVTVVYPQLVDGKVVYDEGGALYGMNVNVNVRHKRASGIWNLATRNFQVSSYAGETDAAVLIGIAEKGGVYGDQWTQEGAKIVEVELGTPETVFTRVWQWNGSVGNELTVPSLVFPVLNAPQDFWRTNVTVPLAKDLLQAPKGTGGFPMPVDAVDPAVR